MAKINLYSPSSPQWHRSMSFNIADHLLKYSALLNTLLKLLSFLFLFLLLSLHHLSLWFNFLYQPWNFGIPPSSGLSPHFKFFNFTLTISSFFIVSIIISILMTTICTLRSNSLYAMTYSALLFVYLKTKTKTTYNPKCHLWIKLMIFPSQVWYLSKISPLTSF